MVYLNKLTDDDIPIPIPHIRKPERTGKDMTGQKLYEFGLTVLLAFLQVQNGKLEAINMSSDTGCPNIILHNPQCRVGCL
jgi:hypothetical protein